MLRTERPALSEFRSGYLVNRGAGVLEIPDLGDS